MLRTIILSLGLSLGLSSSLFAAENVPVEARLIGGTFKTLAKAYVATVDIEKLRSKKIQRIESMRDGWFNEKYAEVYPDICKLPPAILKKYGVVDSLTKTQAIRIIRTLKKNDLYEIIDSVPDIEVARRFNEQFEGDPSGKKVSLQDKIKQTWDNLLVKINQGAAPAHPR